MAKTVVGLYENFSDAQAVVRDLESAGFKRASISVVRANASGGTISGRGDAGETAKDAATGAGAGAVLGGIAGLAAFAIPGIGPAIGMGTLATALGVGAGVGAAAGGLIGALTSSGVPEDEARLYEEGVRRGGTLVSVRTEDEDADQAIAIFNRHNPIDLDTRAAQWRQAGWKGAAAATQPTRTTATASAGATGRTQNVEGQQAIPIVEEELQVGKREVQRGGVRVHTHVQERPVEEQVKLREEHVRVERRPVDRPATPADINKTFQQGTIEVTERAEEAVVQKNARVVEEVVVGKEATQRTETVRDTVRRTDVNIQEIPATGARTSVDWQKYDADFRTNFQSSFTGGEYTYDQVRPAYRYGYELGGSSTEWNENDARRRWEERNPGTWEKFKNAARYAYDRAKAKVS